MATNTTKDKKLVLIFDLKDVVDTFKEKLPVSNTQADTAMKFATALIAQEIPSYFGGSLVTFPLRELLALTDQNTVNELYVNAFNLLYSQLSDFLPVLEEMTKSKRIIYEKYTSTRVRLVIRQTFSERG